MYFNEHLFFLFKMNLWVSVFFIYESCVTNTLRWPLSLQATCKMYDATCANRGQRKESLFWWNTVQQVCLGIVEQLQMQPHPCDCIVTVVAWQIFQCVLK